MTMSAQTDAGHVSDQELRPSRQWREDKHNGNNNDDSVKSPSRYYVNVYSGRLQFCDS
jgi:hypothetical protein